MVVQLRGELAAVGVMQELTHATLEVAGAHLGHRLDALAHRGAHQTHEHEHQAQADSDLEDVHPQHAVLLPPESPGSVEQHSAESKRVA